MWGNLIGVIMLLAGELVKTASDFCHSIGCTEPSTDQQLHCRTINMSTAYISTESNPLRVVSSITDQTC